MRDGPSPQPAHPLTTLCCCLGTCYGQGQLLGGAQHVPGQAVDPGQLVLRRRGAVPRGISGAMQPSDPYVWGFRGQLWFSHLSLTFPLLAPALDFQVHQYLLGPGTSTNQGREAVGCRDKRLKQAPIPGLGPGSFPDGWCDCGLAANLPEPQFHYLWDECENPSPNHIEIGIPVKS